MARKEDVEPDLEAHGAVDKAHRPLTIVRQVDGPERPRGPVNRQFGLLAFVGAKGADIRLPAGK